MASYFSVSQQLIYRKGTLRPRRFDELNGRLVVTNQFSSCQLIKTLKEMYILNSEWEESETKTTSQLLEELSEGKNNLCTGPINQCRGTTNAFTLMLLVAFEVTEKSSINVVFTKSR